MEDQKFKKALELIIRFKMSKEEAKAYKVSLLYEEIAEKVLAGTGLFRRTHFNKKLNKVCDPRKNYLFKCCYTMLEQTQGKLNGDEYKLFIKAQLDILKKIKSADGIHPNIDPRVLLGPGAWRRWLKWKGIYKSRKTMFAEEMSKNDNLSEEIKLALQSTKDALVERLPDLSEETLIAAIESKSMIRWIMAGVISPYYVLMSPMVSKWITDNHLTHIDCFYIDPGLYENNIKDSVIQYFKALFPHEF